MKFNTRFLCFFLMCSVGSIMRAQSDSTLPSVKLKKGSWQLTIFQDERVLIKQNAAINGRLRIKADSLVKVGDTLVVRPWFILQQKYRGGKRNPPYVWPANNSYKIPIKEIKQIVIKRQPLCFILTSAATISYVWAFAAIFAIPPDSEANINKRTTIAENCFKVFIPSFAARLLIGKKHIRLNGKKSTVKSWSF